MPITQHTARSRLYNSIVLHETWVPRLGILLFVHTYIITVMWIVPLCFTYIHTHTHTYIHTHIHTYTHTYMHTYIHYTHTHIHTYIHTYIHTHTHTYIHTYIHKQKSFSKGAWQAKAKNRYNPNPHSDGDEPRENQGLSPSLQNSGTCKLPLRQRRSNHRTFTKLVFDTAYTDRNI